MKWYQILNEVNEAKGKQKQVVLEKYKDDELLQEVLLFLNSPRIVTGISKKKWEKKTGSTLQTEVSFSYIVSIS